MIGHLFAFGFYTPWMLAGILLAGLPILIHYWFRRNYQVTEWAAVQFLLSAVQKHSKRIRLEQLILLSVRVLLIALVAFAMAEPYLSAGRKEVASGGSVHRILVIDDSYSMGKRGFKGTTLEKAKTIAREIVEKSARGDFLSLFRITSVSPSSVIGEPTLYHNTVLREIEQMELTDEPGDLQKVLEEVRKTVEEHSLNNPCEIIFLTDMQRSLWNPLPDTRTKELMGQLDFLGRSSALHIIDVGDEKQSNLAVTSLQLDDSFVVVDRPASFSAKVKNFGFQPVEDQFVELYVDGHLVETGQIDIPAGGEQTVSFSHIFSLEGPHQLEVRMAEDILPVDQNRWLSLEVQKTLKVLLVNGRKAEDPVNQATYYLKTALESHITGEDDTGIFDLDLAEVTEWFTLDLDQYDAVFLVDVPDFQAEEAIKLRKYVTSGGGLVVCMGAEVDITNYNRWNLGSPEGFLPAEILGESQEEGKSFLFAVDDLSHPMLQPFEGNPGAGLESTVVLNYMKVKPTDQFPVKIPLRFQTGDPVLVETDFQKGKIVLITTSLDLSWGTWAVQPSFPPMIYELTKHVVSGHRKVSDQKVGTLYQVIFPNMIAGSSVSIVLPDQSKVTTFLSENGNQPGLIFSNTLQAGIYNVESGEDKKLLARFAVNLDTTESDLARLSVENLRNQLSPETGLSASKEWKPDQAPLSASVETRSGLYRGVILMVLGLFFVELLMAWKFTYGLALLTFFGLLGLSMTIDRVFPFPGWGVFVIALIVILILNRGRLRFPFWFKA